jgi:hypothetical protein
LSKVGLAHEGYEKMLAEETEKPEAITRAHRNFLKEAVYLLYLNSRVSEANRWLAVLKEKYPDAVAKDMPVEQYALERMVGTIAEMNHNRTKAVIEGLLTQHFENLAIDNDERADGVLRMARQVWTAYDASIAARREPLKFDPLNEMYARSRDRVLDPQTGFPPEYAARLRTKLGLPAPETSKPSDTK